MSLITIWLGVIIMFNFFGDSMMGKIGNSVVNARLQQSSIGSLAEYMNNAYGNGQQQSDAFAPSHQDEFADPGKASAFEQGTKPLVGANAQQFIAPSDQFAGSNPPMATGSKGIKGILGAVFPVLGMAFAKHDQDQMRQRQMANPN